MELLIVIAIISLLVGLVVAGLAAMRTSGERQKTAALLSQLAAALTEYQVQTKGQSPDPMTSNSDGSINEFIEQVMALGEDNPAERMLRSVDASFWSTPYIVVLPNTLVIRDAWGHQIEYIANTGYNDAPFDTNPERQPARPKHYFASPGPDGLWGGFNVTNQEGNIDYPDPALDTNNDGTPDAKDNLYSFKLTP